jgi:hypothetical protein
MMLSLHLSLQKISMMRSRILFIVGCMFFLKNLHAQQCLPITTQAGQFVPVFNQGILDKNTWDAIPELDGYKFLLLQFETLPNESTQKTLKSRSIELLTYLPKQSYYAKVAAAFKPERFSGLNLSSVSAPDVSMKIHQEVKNNLVPEHAKNGSSNKYIVTLFPGTDDLKFVQYLRNMGGLVLDNYNHEHLTISLNPQQVNMLAQWPGVQFIHFIDVPFLKENLLNRTDHRSNSINTDYGAGRHLNGQGVRIGLTDDGFIGPHIDYKGRTTQDAVASYNGGDHGDHCGGTIMGAGNLDPNGKGMAPNADLWVYDALSTSNYILEDSLFSSPNLSLDIISTSYSNGCNTGYNAGANSADRQIHDFKNIMRIFSAGNDGTNNCGYGAGANWGNITGGIKLGKNLIAVANLNYLDVLANSSSRGPASDGRIKPDVSAVGTDVYSTIDTNDYALKTGTSMSCPGVAGLFAQLYQGYRELHANQDPNAGLLKNVLMNTCDDIGNPGPDFKHGYGRVNGLRAIQILENNQHWNDSVSTGITKTLTLNVPPNTHRVKIMLNWMDKEAAVSATTALVNDLDLVVTDPNSNVFLPWVLNHAPNATTLDAPAQRLVDHLNNAEQVTIDTPTAGNYTIDVSGFAVPFGPQEYFISYEFISFDSLEISYPLGGEGFRPGETQTIRWNAISTGNTFNIDYSSDNGSSWQSIATALPATQTYYNWTVPALTSGNCKIRVSRNGISSESPSTFTIMNIPSNLTLVRVCPDTITIKWNATPTANGYQVYHLGNKYMDLVTTTTDTIYHFIGLNPNVENWFSVAALQSASNAVSRRAFAIQQNPGLLNCVLAVDAEMISCDNPGKTTLLDCNSTSIPVKVKLQNNGLNTITNFNVSYQLDNNAPVTEVFSTNLSTSSQTTFTFTTGLAAPSAGLHNLKVWLNLSGDLYLFNDTLNYTIIGANSVVAALPWSEDFENEVICSEINACDNTDCVFAGDLTNEQNLVIDQFDWKVYSGPTPTNTTGPDVDHTLNSAAGKYVYTESSYCFNQSAFLLTPCFSLATASKPYFSFWYHLYGNGQGSLHVDAFVDGEWQNDITTSIAGNQGNTWFKKELNLSTYAGKTIYLRLRGLTGINQRSDMALDDLMMVDSAASPSSTNAILPSSLNVFPNPGQDFIQITALQPEMAFDEIKLYSVVGALMIEEKLNKEMNWRLPVASLSSGIYWLQIKHDGKVLYQQKWVKQE